jgi:hypothetical protein
MAALETEDIIGRYRTLVRRGWPVVIGTEIAVGWVGAYCHNVQLMVVGFGMALYLYCVRVILQCVGRWPQ